MRRHQIGLLARELLQRIGRPHPHDLVGVATAVDQLADSLRVGTQIGEHLLRPAQGTGIAAAQDLGVSHAVASRTASAAV